MSIYDDEGVPNLRKLQHEFCGEPYLGAYLRDESLVVWGIKGDFCTIVPSDVSPFRVRIIDKRGNSQLCDTLSSVLARVRELAETARESSPEEPVGEKTPEVSSSDEEKDARIYKCADCGAMRSEREGGKVFTVCDECWDKAYPRDARLGEEE